MASGGNAWEKQVLFCLKMFIILLFNLRHWNPNRIHLNPSIVYDALYWNSLVCINFQENNFIGCLRPSSSSSSALARINRPNNRSDLNKFSLFMANKNAQEKSETSSTTTKTKELEFHFIHTSYERIILEERRRERKNRNAL